MSKSADSCQTLENSTLNEVSITPQQYNEILEYQEKILSMIASHEKTQDILNALCSLAEKLLPDSVASLMLLNKNTGLMNIAAAPSIPEVGHNALANLQPGPGGGSCGNAVFRNEPQFVKDTFNDVRWENIRHIAEDFNLCACWSMPVRDENKKAVGSFALSSFEHRSPAAFHKKLLETAASIVSIVLKNQANEKRLELFHNAMENASQGIVITNSQNKIVEVNKAFESIYGLSEKEVLGKNPKIVASGKHKRKFYTDMWKSLQKTSTWSGEIINKAADGKEITQWVSITALQDEEKNAFNYFAIFTDLTELKETQKKLERMAYTDTLTALRNKSNLEKLLETTTYKTLILLNLNNFSYINTAYGFELGDKLLVKIAYLLQYHYGCDNVFRINSDEFALLFKGKINIEEKILGIQKYFYDNEITLDDIQMNVSFSYGISKGRRNLLRNSALALKQAKENGKNNYHIFNPNEDSINHSHRESFIASNHLLHLALNEDRVVPYFQGIRDNRSQEITKFECLVRIKKGDEIVSPFVFLEAAKLSGMLPEITKVMIDKSFKIMATNDYTFSINVTEDDLSKNYLVDYLTQKASHYKIEASRITLEILEGISSSGKQTHISQLNVLKAMGYNIAIDDFGSEYSNFERILELDIDFLKIDAKYIKDIDKNEKSYEITRAIAFFAQNANIPCIAEFVHSAEVQKIVEDLGIHYSQGYLFSEPSPLPMQ